MRRRIFIKNIGVVGAGYVLMPLSLHIDKAYAQLRKASTSGDGNIKKYVLQEYAHNQYRYSPAEDVSHTINTMFWLTIDPGGKMSSSERRNALVSKQVTKEDLYRACHFKNTSVEDFFASAYDWTWAGGTLAAGLLLPPSAAVSIGLLAVGTMATAPVNWSIEAQKEAQRNLCEKTVTKYFLAKSNVKRFMENERIHSITQIPFKKEMEDIITKLPVDNIVRKTVETLSSTTSSTPTLSTEDLLHFEHQEQEKKLQLFQELLRDQLDQRQRQVISANLEFQDRERQAAIYLTQQALSTLFGNVEIGNKFHTLASAINTIYSTYKMTELGNTMTLAATANYVGAGLAIISLFQGSSSQSSVYKELFKSIRQLTEIVVKGFNEIHKTQMEILKQLNELTKIVIDQGFVEVGMLRRVQSEIEAFRADYNYDQFSQIESSLNRVRFRINDLFKNEKFNVAKANYREQFLSHIETFVFHAVDTSVNNRILSGYSSNLTIQDLVNKYDRAHRFEYMIGTVPVVHKMLHIFVTFSAIEYDKQIPNPYEWSRAFYLYYQSIFATGLENAVVKGHIAQFLHKGELIKAFLNKYTDKNFINSLIKSHEVLSTQLISKCSEKFKSILQTESYHLYEYALSNVNNIRFHEDSTLHDFASFGDPPTQNFIVTKADALVNARHIYGYRTSFSIPRILQILRHLDIIEPYPYTSGVFPHPTINFRMRYATLKFKNTQVNADMVFTDAPHDLASSSPFKSYFVYGKDLDDLVKVRGGAKAANFRDVLETQDIPADYWKVFPKGGYQKELPAKESIDFLDFFKNEIIHAELKKRKQLINRFNIQESNIMEDSKSIVEQLNAIGYLLSAALTFMEYKRQDTSIYSYLERSHGIENVMKPLKSPYAFAKDIFDNYVNFLLKDVYNDYRSEKEDKEQFWKFKNSYQTNSDGIPSMQDLGVTDYQLTKYATENVLSEIKSCNMGIEEIAIDKPHGSNYNVEKIVNECKTYLGTL